MFAGLHSGLRGSNPCGHEWRRRLESVGLVCLKDLKGVKSFNMFQLQ